MGTLRADHLTFEGEGDMGDLAWLRIFSSKPPEIEFFPQQTTVQDFFSSMMPHERFFFSVQELFSPSYFLARFFPP